MTVVLVMLVVELMVAVVAVLVMVVVLLAWCYVGDGWSRLRSLPLTGLNVRDGVAY